VITFLDNNKQAMLLAPKGNALPTLLFEVQKNILINDAGVNREAESRYLQTHPLPKGYEDVQTLNEYGLN
jgi:hypothetical protein